MIKSVDIMNYIEGLLNSMSARTSISFKGGVDVVNADWRRKNFGKQITPFSLATQAFEFDKNLYKIDFRYALYIMPFANDRAEIENLVDDLYAFLGNNEIVIDSWKLNITPNRIEYGEDFSEGSGAGFQRFEVILNFSGYATNNYTIEDVSLLLDDGDLPFISLKYSHGKISFVNKTAEFESINNAHNLNSNALIIQTPLSSYNTVAQQLIGSRQKVNMETEIKLSVGETTIIDDVYEYEGFTFATGVGDQTLSVFLYFSYASDKSHITINGENIPILDYAISVKSDLLPHSNPLSNTVKNFWLGEARAFAFNIAEDNEYTVINTFYDYIEGKTQTIPIYEVEMNLSGVAFTKELVVDDITKESKETGKSVLRVTMLESEE